MIITIVRTLLDMTEVVEVCPPLFIFQLLKYFRASEPWTRVYSSPPAENKKPSDFSAEALEYELFRLSLEKRKQRYAGCVLIIKTYRGRRN